VKVRRESLRTAHARCRLLHLLRHVALLVLLAGCVVSGGDPAPGQRSEAAPGAPVVLFEGASLAGWAQAGPGGFDLHAGMLQSRGGMGLLWYTERTFRDFVLELDWRTTAQTDNSGVFVRFPDPGDDPLVAVSGGYEVQINDNPAGDPQKTGALYGVQSPSTRASRPTGQWNHYMIRAVGSDYTVSLNGVTVNRFTSRDPTRGLGGRIGLQNHDTASTVQFRDIRVRPAGT
jgi:hypothetical protein